MTAKRYGAKHDGPEQNIVTRFFMSLSRRHLLELIAAACGSSMLSRAASAEAGYPSRPVRIVAGFAAGGGVDITARLIGQWLTDRLGQPFLVENRTGADGNIATEAVVNAPADGYMLLLATLPNAVNASLYPHLKFNFLHDIAPVAGVIRVPMVVLVHPSLPAKTILELIAYANENPGKINMASAGIGSAPHMAGESFNAMAGTKMVHVPYRGQSQALTDLLGGQVQILFAAAPGTADYIRSGKLRALAITSPSQAEVLKDLPVVASALPGYEASQWYGITAPKGTPTEATQRLSKEINAVVADANLKARLSTVGVDSISMTSAEFGNFIAAETEKWKKVVEFAGLKVE